MSYYCNWDAEFTLMMLEGQVSDGAMFKAGQHAYCAVGEKYQGRPYCGNDKEYMLGLEFTEAICRQRDVYAALQIREQILAIPDTWDRGQG